MRRFFAFVGAVVAALALSVPPQSVALQGVPRPHLSELISAGEPDAGDSRSSTNAEISRRSRRARAQELPLQRPQPRDSADVGSDSTATAAAPEPEQSIAVTVQVLNLDHASYRTALEQSYPNPSVGPTVIRYSLARSARFTIAIYSILGQRVATLVDRDHEPGNYSVTWDLTDDCGRRVAPGVYIYRGVGGSYTATRKLIVR
jgi:hypothetical protein